MIRFEPFSAGDLLHLDVQAEHAHYMDFLCQHFLSVRHAAEGAFSYTGWTEHGIAVASCGILANSHAWALLSGSIGAHFRPVTRKVRSVLQDHLDAVGPVYADIDTNHEAAVRWAALLGFEFWDRGAAGMTKWVFK